MSIIAVHGPNTWGSGAVRAAGPVMGTVSAANGLQWDFKLALPTTRADQDFSWAFPPDGTPTPQTVADPSVTTYASAGSKTATLTVTNVAKTVTNKALTANVATLSFAAAPGFKVGQVVDVAGVDATFNGTYTVASVVGSTITYALTAANVTSTASSGTVTSNASQYPAAGSYPITVTAVSGAGPMMAEAATTTFDPSEHTVSDVLAYAAAHEDEAGAIYDLEVEGKNRSTLLTQLEQYIPYDPGDYTVTDVVAYAQANPDQLQEIIAMEQAGKNRSTLLSQLEAL